MCKTRTGHAEEELALQAKADQLNPRSPWKFSRYRHMGFAALDAGAGPGSDRVPPAIACHEPGSPGPIHRGTYRMLAAAHARTGQIDEAMRWLSAAGRLLALQHSARCLSGRADKPGLCCADQSLSGRHCGSRARVTTPMKTPTSAFRQTDRCTAKMPATRRLRHRERRPIRTAELVAAARRGFASGHRYGLEFMGPIDPGRGRAQVLRIGRQLRRRGPGSLAPQDGRTDRRRSRPACRCSRLELRAL